MGAACSIAPDHLNTPRFIADQTQKIVWRWDQQKPFGATPPNDDPDGDGVKFDFPLRFPGQYFDRETNLAYNYFRDYDSNPASKAKGERGIAVRKLFALSVVFVPLIVGCSSTPIDELLIHREARDIKKYFESNWRQISYSVDLKYPAAVLTDDTFAEMKKLGWSKCSGYREGWDSFVDAAEGEGREQTVFQDNSNWFKDSTLVTISMRYYAGVTKDKRRLNAPDNTQQHVIVLENKNPGVKEMLGITC